MQHAVNRAFNLKALMVGGLLTLVTGFVLAGTTGTEFQIFYQLVTDWMGGYLGRGLALLAVLIGVGVGIFRGSLMLALTGIGVAMVLFVAPNVINGILAATI